MYTKFQLAAQYFPEDIDNGKVAVQKLSRWINRCKPLLQALERQGYHKWQKHFTAKQVDLIYEHLGEP